MRFRLCPAVLLAIVVPACALAAPTRDRNETRPGMERNGSVALPRNHAQLQVNHAIAGVGAGVDATTPGRAHLETKSRKIRSSHTSMEADNAGLSGAFPHALPNGQLIFATLDFGGGEKS